MVITHWKGFFWTDLPFIEGMPGPKIFCIRFISWFNRTIIDQVWMYSSLDTMGHSSKTELNLTHFYTGPNSLLDLWKYLAALFQKQLEFLKNLLVELCGKEIYGPWWPNISLTENMVRFTYIWRHKKSYIHVIIYVGFYVDPCYWKYTQTHARRQ